jgi:hypothetical protein
VAVSPAKSRARYETGEVTLAARRRKSRVACEMELSRGPRASANRAPPHQNKLRERSEHRPQRRAVWRREQRRTFLCERRRRRDPKRDCASSKPRRKSVGPSKYELQGPTVQPELSDVSS